MKSDKRQRARRKVPPLVGCSYSVSDLFGPPKNCGGKTAFTARIETDCGEMAVNLCRKHAVIVGIPANAPAETRRDSGVVLQPVVRNSESTKGE